MAAPKLRTPADATISAPADPATSPFIEQCRARHAVFLRSEAERAQALVELGTSRAFATAEAAFAEHAGRWARARLDTLAAAGCSDTPARDRFPFWKGFPS